MISVELMVGLATILSLLGAFLVARAHILWANCVWATCDVVFIMYALIIDDMNLLILFGLYEVIAFYAIIRILNIQRRKRLKVDYEPESL